MTETEFFQQIYIEVIKKHAKLMEIEEVTEHAYEFAHQATMDLINWTATRDYEEEARDKREDKFIKEHLSGVDIEEELKNYKTRSFDHMEPLSDEQRKYYEGFGYKSEVQRLKDKVDHLLSENRRLRQGNEALTEQLDGGGLRYADLA